MEKAQLVSGVQRLSESLGELPEPVAEPVLVVVCGLPGTGKSYLARRLAERVPFLILESDAMRKVLSPLPSYDSRESAQLFQAIHELVDELLRKGISLILDATNLSERFREHLYDIADRLGVRLVLVSVGAPPEIVRERLANRVATAEGSSDADWAVYQKLAASVDRIRRNHYVVDTSRDIEPVLAKIVREITG